MFDEAKVGVVYLFHAEGTNLYKIGRTSTPVKKRLAQTRTGCPYPLRIDTVTQTLDDCHLFERVLHSWFDSFRRSGEWFEFDEEYAWLVRDILTCPADLINTKDGDEFRYDLFVSSQDRCINCEDLCGYADHLRVRCKNCKDSLCWTCSIHGDGWCWDCGPVLERYKDFVAFYKGECRKCGDLFLPPKEDEDPEIIWPWCVNCVAYWRACSKEIGDYEAALS